MKKLIMLVAVCAFALSGSTVAFAQEPVKKAETEQTEKSTEAKEETKEETTAAEEKKSEKPAAEETKTEAPAKSAE